jgi:hypothetical protein
VRSGYVKASFALPAISHSGLHFGLEQAVSFFPGGRPAVGVPVPSVLGQSSASGSLGGELFGGLAFQAF